MNQSLNSKISQVLKIHVESHVCITHGMYSCIYGCGKLFSFPKGVMCALYFECGHISPFINYIHIPVCTYLCIISILSSKFS